MRVLILGGTGAIGLLLIREALEHHHTVTIYARSPEKLPEDIKKNTAVVVVKGQLLDEEQLSKAMEGVNAVISALGPAVSRGPFHPSDTPLARAYSLLIKVMRKHNVKRLIALGTSSIRDSNDKFNV
jgi:putative NADH-flavin reductase